MDIQYAIPKEKHLKSDWKLWRFVIFTPLTLGLYPVFAFARIGSDINTIASSHDNKNTMNFWLVFLIFSWLTFGIVPLIWFHNLSNRVGTENTRRQTPYSHNFNAGTFWLWFVVGSIILIGPLVYISKLCNTMNAVAADYNLHG